MAISNISDTARWVAAFRALESERPDAVFRDPFARALAGSRGFELANKLRGAYALGWTMAVRTRVLDEMLLEAIYEGNCDVVLNLAAGLDTRPNRLPLPRELRWIEADLPGILEHKESVLGNAPANCRVERIRVDLADDAARTELLARIGAESRRAVVLTEGLLVYLPEPAVANLARELHAQSGFAFWMMDLIDWRALQVAKLLWNGQLATGDAKMQFGPRQGPAYFAEFGWKHRATRTMVSEGARLRRGLGNRIWAKAAQVLPGPARDMARDSSGLCWLER
jgi:methyltransferase (TIGR00027 family)